MYGEIFHLNTLTYSNKKNGTFSFDFNPPISIHININQNIIIVLDLFFLHLNNYKTIFIYFYQLFYPSYPWRPFPYDIIYINDRISF